MPEGMTFDEYKDEVKRLIDEAGYKGPVDEGFIQDDFKNEVSSQDCADGFLEEHSVEDTENNEDGDIPGTGEDLDEDEDNYNDDEDDDKYEG